MTCPLILRLPATPAEIRASFDRLVPDTESVDRVGRSMAQQRRRRYALLDVTPGRLPIARVSPVFTQRVDDFRNTSRRFAAMEPGVRDSRFLRRLVSEAVKRVSVAPGTCAWTVSVHQVRQIAWAGSPSDNAPEGVHRDGADVIVSAFVVARRNVRGGRSDVYAPDRKRIILNHTLEPDEGLLHEDRQLWHDVTRVWSPSIGHRDLFGLDMTAVPC